MGFHPGRRSYPVPTNISSNVTNKPAWLVGTNAAYGIGIQANLNRVVSTRTTPLNYSSGELKDDRKLVICQNTLSGVGRKRSQFNVDADGITTCRYYIGDKDESGGLLDFFVTSAPTAWVGTYVGVITSKWEYAVPPNWIPAGNVSPPSVGSYSINYILLQPDPINSNINICCSNNGACNFLADGPFNSLTNYSITITSKGVTATIVTASLGVAGVGGFIYMDDTVGGTSAANVIAANTLINNICNNFQPFRITFNEI